MTSNFESIARKISSGFAFLTLFATGAEASALTYSVRSLGTLGGQYSYSSAINENGAVAGYSITAAGIPEAFVYVNESIRSLGSPTYKAHGINDKLEVAGVASTQDGARAFLRTGEKTITLGTLSQPLRAGRSWALSINNEGTVVGWATNQSGVDEAFIYSGQTMMGIGSYLNGSQSSAVSINDTGQVVGYVYSESIGIRGFVYYDKSSITLGTLGGNYSDANAINIHGSVTGTSTTAPNSGYQAFLYEGGVMNPLGTLTGTESSGLDINDSGQIVGSFYSNAQGSRGFIYTDGSMKDLNLLLDSNSSSTWTIQAARAINNSGQIAADGYDNSGRVSSLLLTPIPEPSTIAMFLIGISALLVIWRIKHLQSERPGTEA